MLKITERHDNQEKVHLFQDNVVIIGGGSDPKANLPISGHNLKDEHIKIFRNNGILYVQNMANDPFAALNDQPFYKKKVSSGDTLKIRNLEFRIEDLSKTEKREDEGKVETIASPLLPELNLQEELRKIETDEESLPVEEPFEEIISAPVLKNPEKKKLRRSLKDFDSPPELGKEFKTAPSQSPVKNIKLFSFGVIIVLIILSIVALESYLRVQESNDREELVAAESLSDIAMALTYAQLYHIAPQKHSWSDPEFIQNNLIKIMQTQTLENICINPQGAFTNCPYNLRIYTSNDLSRFLIIAYPAPSLTQWISPKNSIIIDSSSMELRKIKDLKAINRLLANLNTLDGVNVTPLKEQIKKGEIIPLSFLAKALEKPEFAPPPALAFIRPGAENYIYNAPRYYPFGGAILKKVIQFSFMNSSSHELQMLQSELELLKKLPNLIFYISQYSDMAREAKEALKQISPQSKFLMATLKYDSKGGIRSSQIVMDSEIPQKKTKTALKPYVKEIGHLSPSHETDAAISLGRLPEQEIAENEEPHLLLKNLIALKNEKENTLKDHKAAILAKLNEFFDSECEENKETLIHEITLYKKKAEEADEALKQKIFNYLFEYSDVSRDDFIGYLEKTDLLNQANDLFKENTQELSPIEKIIKAVKNQ